FQRTRTTSTASALPAACARRAAPRSKTALTCREETKETFILALTRCAARGLARTASDLQSPFPPRAPAYSHPRTNASEQIGIDVLEFKSVRAVDGGVHAITNQ